MTAPHILLITCDELRADFLPTYGGHGLVDTPAIDRLAATSTVFDDAYAPSPLCMPSRYSILTGQYPHHHGLYSNFRDRRLDPRVPNLYNILRASGYHTAHIGKCHYTATDYRKMRRDATTDREPVREFILSLGLDHLDLNNGKNNSIWYWNDYSRELEGTGLLRTYREAVWDHQDTGKSFAFPGPRDWHPDWWCARKAIEHIDCTSKLPATFTWVSFPGPHYPHDPPAEYLDRVHADRLPLLRFDPREFASRDRVQYDAFHGLPRTRGCEGLGGGKRGFKDIPDDEWRAIQHHYLANIALLDDAIGAVVDRARAAFGGSLKVILTADHGDCMGAHRLWAKNACGYHEVLRVPLIASTGAAPGRSTARVSLIDLLPTCCDWSGSPLPAERDGRSLMRSLEDGGHAYLAASMDGQLIVHDRRWKLLTDVPTGLIELYDRGSDPDEYVNRALDPSAADELRRLQALSVRMLLDGCLG
jgi:arylsulfatase A-like enzyme